MQPHEFTALCAVLGNDAAVLLEKDKQYGASWKTDGGVGAWFVMKRKWDRIVTALRPDGEDAPTNRLGLPAWNILRAMLNDPRPESLLGDVRDLRRYLTLFEADLLANAGLDTESELKALGITGHGMRVTIQPEPVPMVHDPDWSPKPGDRVEFIGRNDFHDKVLAGKPATVLDPNDFPITSAPLMAGEVLIKFDDATLPQLSAVMRSWLAPLRMTGAQR